MNHITLYPTGKCNLACEYCFERFYNWDREDSNEEIMKKSIDFLFEEGKNENNLNVSFFGGEPTLRPDLIEFACSYAEEKAKELNKNISFSITTNLTLISDKLIEIFKKHNIHILASIDGMPHENNKRYWNGTNKSSADVALKNLIKLKEENLQITVRWTISKETLQYLYEDVKEFISLGFYNLAIEFVYEEKWRKDDLEKLEQELRKIAKLYIEKLREGIELNIKAIDDGFQLFKMDERQTLRCGLGYFGLGISPTGNILPCHRFVSRPDQEKFSLGNVLTGFNRDERDKLVEVWSLDKIKVEDGRECKDCPIKLRCPGSGCLVVNLDTTGDIFTTPKSYCDIEYIKQKVANDVLGVLYGEKNEIMMKKLGQA